MSAVAEAVERKERKSGEYDVKAAYEIDTSTGGLSDMEYGKTAERKNKESDRIIF